MKKRKRKTNGNYAEDDENEHSDGSPTLKKKAWTLRN